MNFWLLIAILLIVSVLFLLWVLKRRLPIGIDLNRQRVGRNVGLYQQRLARLDEEFSQGEMTQEVYDGLTNDLSRNLLADASRLASATQKSQIRRKWLWLLLPAPLLALFIYASIGSYADWEIKQELESLSASQTNEEYTKKLEALHARLDKRLQQRPDNIEYRFLLASYAMRQENFDGASAHYRVLLELLPNDADVLGYYAQAEYLRENRKVTPAVSNAINKALEINPMQKTVLGLKGIDAFDRGDLQTGIDAWEKLLLVLGDDAHSTAMIREGIRKAKQELGQTETVPDKLIADNPGIDVTVVLGNALPEMDPSLSVFVYAKAANGPPMPLAVKRMQLKDLPAEIRLDDSMAMMPQMKLSSYEEVVIGARISFSGQPTPGKGDWQGETQPIHWKNAGKTEVEISVMVK